MIKSWLEWTTVTCCAFSFAFSLMDTGRRVMSVRKLLDSKQNVRRHSCISAARNDWIFWQDLDLLLNFSPDAFSLSLFLILHDVSLSHSVYGCFFSLSVPLASLLSSSNSSVVPHPLRGHTISSLGSSRGNTFCVRSALEVSHNLLCSLSSSFLLYTAPCREIFSCFFYFIPPISLSACGLELLSRLDVSRWSFSLSSVFLLLWWGEQLLFYFHRPFTLPWKCYTSC